MIDSNSTRDGGVTSSTNIGDKGEAWFFYALPDGWIWQPPRLDVGKDGLIVIRDRSELHNLEFSVQVKTSRKPTVQDGHIVIRGVSRSSVQYWFASPLPTLVVAVDLSSRTARYGWHLELFDSPKQVFEASTPTLSIRIPEANLLDGSGWKAIRRYLLQHFRALQRALTVDAVAPHVMATLHKVSRITGNLIRLGAVAPPEPPLTRSEGMTILIEQIELRDLLDTVRALLLRLVVGSDLHKQVESWLMSFENAALGAHPTIRSLPPSGSDIPADLELGFAPKRLLEVRPQLVRAAVDLLRLLTSPRLGSDTEAKTG